MAKIRLDEVQRAGDPRPLGAMAVFRDGKATVVQRHHYVRTVLEGHLKSAAERGETAIEFCVRVDGAVSEAEDVTSAAELVKELESEKFTVDQSKLAPPEMIIRVSWE